MFNEYLVQNKGLIDCGSCFAGRRVRKILLERNYGTTAKDGEKDKEPEPQNVGTGIIHDKTKSLQEESFFLKEEMEKLKILKKKTGDKEQDKEKDKKSDTKTED